MDAEMIFKVGNYGVLPVWLLLVFLPRWRVTELIAGSAVVSLAIAAIYGIVAVTALPNAEGSMATLSGVQLLFSDPWVALIGWLHYLAFDLFIGAWEVRNARRVNIRHLYVVPCLVATLMLGPVGLLLYFIVRWAHGERLLPADGTAG